MSQAFLPYFQRCAEPVHHCRVGVPERMETIATRNSDTQLHEQRFELSLEQKICVPGRIVLCCKTQSPFIRSPTFEEPSQMFTGLSGKLHNADRCFRFRIAEFAARGALQKLDYGRNRRINTSRYPGCISVSNAPSLTVGAGLPSSRSFSSRNRCLSRFFCSSVIRSQPILN